MGTTQEYKKKIAEKLGILEYQLKRYTDLGLVDEKKAMEGIVCKLLNLVYGYRLRNLNDLKLNYPAIDLGDEQRRIAVQVTSTNSRDKVRETIRKFEKHELYLGYDRLIVFVTGERKEFAKEFDADHVQFSAERDIWDFHMLMAKIDRMEEAEFDKIRKIANLLESEYPDVNSHYIWGKRLLVFFAGLLTIALLWRIGVYCYEKYVETHPKYAYETEMDWLRMDEAASILGTQSQMEVYKSKKYSDSYYQGAALTVLYSNLSNRDRYITRFTVYAENIQEDLSPKLFYNVHTIEDMLIYEIDNEGWGGTGDFTIEYLGMKLSAMDEGQTAVDVKLREDAVTVWEFSDIAPGQTGWLPIFSVNDFQVDYHEEFESFISYEMQFKLYSAETGFAEILECLLHVYSDRIDFMYGGGGQGDERNYVVWVETSEPEWQETYTIHQCLPANETVRLPIFIVPEKSCTMTLRIVFETLDGETMEAAPLENVKFCVPYYDDPSVYIDGKLLDWDKLIGYEVIYFPFKQVDTIVPPEF